MTISQILQDPITLETIAPGGRIGMIALATDFNSEQDMRRMLPPEVEIFTNRVLNANPLTLRNLRDMTGDISRAAAGILPGLALDAMIYGCTSGTIANGADRIAELIHASCPGIEVTNPVDAALAAFARLGANRISILTPYIEEVNMEMAAYFETQGLQIINITGFGFASDLDITAIPLQSIIDAAQHSCDAGAEALFISCTALRSSLVIAQIEALIGRPVVTSNQALAWHCLEMIGYPGTVSGFGQLLETR